MSALAPIRAEVLAGDQVLGVRSFSADRIALDGAMRPGADLPAQFTLLLDAGSSRIRIPFVGQLDAAGDSIAVEHSRFAGLSALLGLRGRLSRRTMRAIMGAPPAPGRALAAAGRAALYSRLLLIAGCIVLGCYVAVRLYDQATSIEPRLAYLATEVGTILSPTSGRVTFAQPKGPIEAGEPVIGIETEGGKSRLIDAPANGDIVSIEKSVGDRVNRDDPLIAIAAPNAPLYLRAIVTREQAFRIAKGASVQYVRLDEPGSAPVVFDVLPGSINVRVIESALQEQLYEVRIPLASGGEHFRALAVQLRFRQDPSVAIRAALEQIGIPAALLDGIAALLGRPARGQGA